MKEIGNERRELTRPLRIPSQQRKTQGDAAQELLDRHRFGATDSLELACGAVVWGIEDFVVACLCGMVLSRHKKFAEPASAVGAARIAECHPQAQGERAGYLDVPLGSSFRFPRGVRSILVAIGAPQWRFLGSRFCGAPNLLVSNTIK